jgi:hypothetical protein
MRMENLNVPKGAEKYKENDLKLLLGERVEKIISVMPVSKLRSFALCILTVVLGFMLYGFFSQPAVTAESLALPVGVLVVAYFVWHYKITENGKKLVFSLVKYSLMIVLLSYLVSYISSVVSPIFQGFSLPRFSLNPVENVYGILIYLADLVNTLFMPYAGYCRILSLGLIVAGFAAIPLVYLKPTNGLLCGKSRAPFRLQLFL